MPGLLRLFSRLLLICFFSVAIVFSQTSADLTASDQYRRIGQSMQQRNYVQALGETRLLIEQAPEFEHAYEKLTQAAEGAGQLNESKAWLASLLQRTPPNYAAYFGMALIDDQKKDYASAIEAYEQYLKAAPDSELAIVKLVRAHDRAGRIAEAELFLRDQLAARPTSSAPHLGLGYYFIRIKKTEEAIKELDVAISLNARTTDACYYKLLAWYYERRYGRVLELIEQHRSAFESDSDKERMKANFEFIGAMYVETGKYSEAVASLEKARTLAVEFGDPATEENYLGQIGTLWLRQDDYLQALFNYQRGFEIAREIKADDDAARHLGNIGWICFLLGDFTAAAQHYNEAFELARKAGDRTNQANILMNVGKVLVDEDKLEQAAAKYLQAFEIGAELSNSATQSTCLDALGSLYIQTGDYEKALVALRQALKLAQEMTTPEQQATTLNTFGELHLHRVQPQQAIESFEQARQIAASIDNLRNVWKAYAGSAAAYQSLGQFGKAREHYRLAIEAMENVRARLGGEEEKVGYFQDKVAVYKKQIALLLDLHGKDTTLHYDVEAFRYSERARGRAFLDLLAEAKVRFEQDLALDLSKGQQELQQRISQLTAQLIKERSQETSKQDKARIGELERGLSQADAELGDWLRELRRSNPRYAALKYPEPITLVQAQRMLDDKTLLLSYSLAEPVSFVFAVSRNDFQVKRLPSEATLSEGIQKLLAAITDKNNTAPEEYRKEAARLSMQLLQPVSRMLAGKTALVIVPDGALHRLPFEALLLPGLSSQGDLRRMPYLIRRFAVSYAPSASVLAGLQNEPRETAPKGFIAFGDPVYEQRAEGPIASTLRAASAVGRLNFQRLPYSRVEIAGIARLFAEEDREVFLGEAASEENVKTPGRLSRYRMVHFSTHGYVNEARPRFSGLVLSLPSSTTLQITKSPRSAIRNPQSEDGLLSAYEIFNLKLKADLVVLSACETGLGKEVKGEGLMSLMRAFMYAGTPSVVVSLWNVNDESAADLMIRFYRHLKSGLTKSEALRQAQLETIRDNGFPFFWAPFVLVGKP